MGLYSRLFARCYDSLMARYEEHIAARKRELFAPVSGTIVEIGPGTGVNLQYVKAGSRWIGIEPNPHMHAAIAKRAKAAGVEAELRMARADGIDVGDAEADVVVSTLVLCSVPDLSRTLAEVRRVLKPTGEFRFIEHVAAPAGTGLRLLQSVIKPAWYALGDGCRIDRDVGSAIEAAGFSELALDTFRVPRSLVPPWVSPHIMGSARR